MMSSHSEWDHHLSLVFIGALLKKTVDQAILCLSYANFVEDLCLIGASLHQLLDLSFFVVSWLLIFAGALDASFW